MIPAGGALPDGLTLADLLTLPSHAGALPPLIAPSRPLFAQLRRTWTPTGVSFHLDGDADAGHVAVDFAVTPRASLRELAASLETRAPVLSERGATADGEHYAVALSDTSGVAVVYGDRHMATLRGRYRREAAARFVELIRRLTVQLPLRGSTPVRERAVIHGVPAGWSARLRDLTTHLVAPDGKSFMTVLPAMPLTLQQSVVHKILYEDVIITGSVQLVDSATRNTPHGLSARIVTARAGAPDSNQAIDVLTAILSDDRFRYVVRHESPTAHSRGLFLETVDSIEPVPRGSRKDPANNPYWAE